MRCTHVAVVVVVNSLTLMHCQGIDLGYTFVNDFVTYRLMRGSLIFALFSAVGMGVSLYAGWLICENIRYTFLYCCILVMITVTDYYTVHVYWKA